MVQDSILQNDKNIRSSPLLDKGKSLLREFVTSQLSKIDWKGKLETMTSLDSGTTIVGMLRQLGDLERLLRNSTDNANAFSIAFLAASQDVIDNAASIDSALDERGAQVIQITETAAATMSDLRAFVDPNESGSTVTDAFGRIYNLYYSSSDIGDEVTIGSHTYKVFVASKPVDNINSEADLICWQEGDKFYTISSLTDKLGHHRALPNIAVDLSQSSEINDFFMDTIDGIRGVLQSDTNDVLTSMSTLLQAKYDVTKSYIQIIYSNIISATQKYGLGGTITSLFSMVGTLRSLTGQNGYLEFVNPEVYMPRQYVAGAIKQIITTAVNTVSYLVTLVSPVVGVALGVFGSIFTTIFTAPIAAYNQETRMKTNKLNLISSPWSQLSLFHTFLGPSNFRNEMVEVLKQASSPVYLSVPGGYLFFGLFEQNIGGVPAYEVMCEFHPSYNHCLQEFSNMTGNKHACRGSSLKEWANLNSIIDTSTYSVYSRDSIKFDEYITGDETIPYLHVRAHNGFGLSQKTMEEVWSRSFTTKAYWENFDADGVADYLTDYQFMVDVQFNTCLFVMWILSHTNDSYDGVFYTPYQIGFASGIATGNRSILDMIPYLFCECLIYQQFVERINLYYFDEYYGQDFSKSDVFFSNWFNPMLSWTSIVTAFSKSYKVTENNPASDCYCPTYDNSWTQSWNYGFVFSYDPRLSQTLAEEAWLGTPEPVLNTKSSGFLIPRYDANSIIKFLAVSAGITVVVGILAAVTVPKIVKWRRDHQQTSGAAVENAWDEVKKHPNDPAVRKAYNKAVRRANFGRILWGGSKYSAGNYWNSGIPESASEVGSDGSSDEPSTFSSLKEVALNQQNLTATDVATVDNPTLQDVIFSITGKSLSN